MRVAKSHGELRSGDRVEEPGAARWAGVVLRGGGVGPNLGGVRGDDHVILDTNRHFNVRRRFGVFGKNNKVRSARPNKLHRIRIYHFRMTLCYVPILGAQLANL